MAVAIAVVVAGGGSGRNVMALGLMDRVYFRSHSDVFLPRYFALSLGKGGQREAGMRCAQCVVIRDGGSRDPNQNTAAEKAVHQGGHRCHNEYRGFGMGGVCRRDQPVEQP